MCILTHTHIHKHAIFYKKRIRDSKWIPERMYYNIYHIVEEVFIYNRCNQNMVRILQIINTQKRIKYKVEK